MDEDSNITRAGTRPSVRRPNPRRYLPVLLGTVTGLVLCVVGLLVLTAINGQTPSPSGTANDICTDLRNAEYSSLYALLTPSLQQQGTNPQAEFSASQQELQIVSGKVMSCSFRLSQSDRTHAIATFSIARGSQGPRSAQVALVFQNGKWRIQNYDSSLV
jgi:hypothetical protein